MKKFLSVSFGNCQLMYSQKDNPLFLGGDVDVPRGNDHDND